MLLNKMRMLGGSTPAPKKVTLKTGYGIYLTHAQGLQDLCITASQKNSGFPSHLQFLGNPTSDGRYEIPLHCHGENILGGEQFAEAMLEAAKVNEKLHAFVEGNFLTFYAQTTAPVLPEGGLRGTNAEIFTIMFSFYAMGSTAMNSLKSGICLTYNSGALYVTHNGAYANDETVSVVAQTSSGRQLIGMTVTSTNNMPRTVDLRTFGIFRGTVGWEDFTPYWGSKTSFYLSAPLTVFNKSKDLAYPLRGYVERWTDRRSYIPESATAIDLGSTHPTYSIPLPEDLWEKDVHLDWFGQTTNQSSFLNNSFFSMRSEDGKSFYITASENYSTAEAFLSFVQSLDMTLITERTTPRFEYFTPIRLSTRKGMNYIDLQTAVAPTNIEFTYY